MTDEPSGLVPDDQTPPEPPPADAGPGESATQNPPPPPPDPAPTSGETAGLSNDERSWAMLCHMLALTGLMMPVVLNVVVPLIMWQLKKNESEFVDDQGKESLNFQLTVSLVLIVLGLLAVVPLLGCLALVALPVAGVAALVYTIIGGLKANEGVRYRYPICLRLVS